LQNSLVQAIEGAVVMQARAMVGLALGLALTNGVAFAQPAAHHHGPHSGREQHAHGQASSASHGHSAYTGMQTRTIKALSDQEIADLRSAKGMSSALPAELNGYPGPSHTMELAEPLQLSVAQRARTRVLFEQMQREAAMAGEELIAAEAELDALFRDRRVTADSLTAAVGKAARARGVVRETHLKYHLSMMDVLSPEQVQAYGQLRGY